MLARCDAAQRQPAAGWRLVATTIDQPAASRWLLALAGRW